MATEKDEQFRRMAEAEDGAAVSAGVWLGDPTATPDPPSAQVKAAEALGRSFAAFLETANPVHREKLLGAVIDAMVAEADEIRQRIDETINQLIDEKTGHAAGAAK
ncbi:MAG TPA: hypothetical protein VFG68_04225 [Fimbriiglobus sp.]|nr:hypothetical protein [Fimbriiglobus sp.]